MKKAILGLTILLSALSLSAREKIDVVNDSTGSRLIVDGTPLFLKGMNWDYFPIGTNYAYSLWHQPDDVIRAALDSEMTLLRMMGVNVIRQYASIPPQWVEYIFRHYGIYTMINHAFGRYGLTIGDTPYDHTDYCWEEVGKELIRESEVLAATYKDTPGILFYLLGNENNYGLFWRGAESEDLPLADSLQDSSAACMYELFNEAALHIKAVDTTHPVALCNGDLQFIDVIARKCPDIDLLGVNSYRGDSFGHLFRDVREKYGKPMFFTEFGADAFNAVTQREAQAEQAEILLNNWQEIYMNAAGMSQSNNCIGGFTFQFSDGWWKCGQDKNLTVHDTNASWGNGGYRFDYVKGQKNMNEEWFGICAKGKPDKKGLYKLYPRKAYEVLREVHQIDPYQTTSAAIQQRFKETRNRHMVDSINSL